MRRARLSRSLRGFAPRAWLSSLAAAALGLLAATPTAEAGNGLAPVGQSARAAGRGGASIAVTEDALGAAHNPALITSLDYIRFDGTVIWFGERVREVSAEGEELEETFVPFPLPIMSLSWDPLATETELDGEVVRQGSDLRVAFSLFQPVTLVFAPSITVALRASDTLSVGATINGLLTFLSFESDGSIGGGGSAVDDFEPKGLVFEHFEADGTPVVPPRPFTGGTGQQVTWGEIFDIVNSGAVTGPPDPNAPPTRQAKTEIEVTDVFGAGVSAQFGMLWQVHPDFAIGATVRTPGIIFNPRGKGRIDLTQALEAVRENPTVGLVLDSVLETYLPDQGKKGLEAEYDVSADKILLPATVGVGFSWYPAPWWLIAVDATWINWSNAFTHIDLKAEGGKNRDFNEVNGGPTIEYRFRLDWRDQWVFSIGTSVGIDDWLVLRAGFNHGSSPIPRETATASSLVVENHATIGVGIIFDRWTLDAAYVYGLPKEVELEESSFKAEQHVVYAGLGYQF